MNSSVKNVHTTRISCSTPRVDQKDPSDLTSLGTTTQHFLTYKPPSHRNLNFHFQALQDHSKLNDLFSAATEFELATSHSWMVVTRVCRHRRNIALSTPVPWKNLHTGTIRPSPRFGGYNHEIPISLIRRSSPASLRLSCTTHVSSESPYDTDVPYVFYEALRDNVEHMESFQIFSFPFLDNTVSDVLDIPLPRCNYVSSTV